MARGVCENAGYQAGGTHPTGIMLFFFEKIITLMVLLLIYYSNLAHCQGNNVERRKFLRR